jgi:AraC-like DNA-binding protein
MLNSVQHLVPKTLLIVPNDPFSGLFAHFAPSARTFFAGNLCATAAFEGGGHLHLLRGGRLRVSEDGQPDLVLDAPTVLFFPRGSAHRFSVDLERGADLACAHIDLGGQQGNALGQGLPDRVVLPLGSVPLLAPTCELLWAEAFAQEQAGRQVALDHLFDYFLILLIRHIVGKGLVEDGVLAGLADPRLSQALIAMHEAPQRNWSLENLADVAGMSRTRFAARFRDVVGQTAIGYLTGWRMQVASSLLAKGTPVKSVASQVGYDDPAAFSRAFSKVIGCSPREWTAEAAVGAST